MTILSEKHKWSPAKHLEYTKKNESWKCTLCNMQIFLLEWRGDSKWRNSAEEQKL